MINSILEGIPKANGSKYVLLELVREIRRNIVKSFVCSKLSSSISMYVPISLLEEVDHTISIECKGAVEPSP
jgi:hypothetical protein